MPTRIVITMSNGEEVVSDRFKNLDDALQQVGDACRKCQAAIGGWVYFDFFDASVKPPSSARVIVNPLHISTMRYE